jgi:hypothetical protein
MTNPCSPMFFPNSAANLKVRFLSHILDIRRLLYTTARLTQYVFPFRDGSLSDPSFFCPWRPSLLSMRSNAGTYSTYIWIDGVERDLPFLVYPIQSQPSLRSCFTSKLQYLQYQYRSQIYSITPKFTK